MSSAPCLSNSSTNLSRIGGSSPESVESLPPPWVVIGAFSCLGSAFGAKPPSASSTRLPATTWTLNAFAVAATTSKPSTTSDDDPLLHRPLPLPFPRISRYRSAPQIDVKVGAGPRLGATSLARRDELGEPAHPLLDVDRAQSFEAPRSARRARRPSRRSARAPRRSRSTPAPVPGCSWTSAPACPPGASTRTISASASIGSSIRYRAAKQQTASKLPSRKGRSQASPRT